MRQTGIQLDCHEVVRVSLSSVKKRPPRKHREREILQRMTFPAIQSSKTLSSRSIWILPSLLLLRHLRLAEAKSAQASQHLMMF